MLQQKTTLELIKEQLSDLRKKNPGKVFRIHYCRKAGERTVQVQESNGNWLCLHDEKE